jgi:excisionase family DNA binding protein
MALERIAGQVYLELLRFVIGPSVVTSTLDPVRSEGASPVTSAHHFYGKEIPMRMTSEADSVTTGTMNKMLLRVGEAATQLSVSRWTIYRWVEEGRLRGTKIGKGSVRIFRDSITSLIEANQSDVVGAWQRSKHS